MTADGVFKETKRRKRVLLIPISKNHVTEILTYSRNVAEAAEQIEKMSLGVQDAPSFPHNAAPAAPAETAPATGGALDAPAAQIRNPVLDGESAEGNSAPAVPAP